MRPVPTRWGRPWRSTQLTESARYPRAWQQAAAAAQTQRPWPRPKPPETKPDNTGPRTFQCAGISDAAHSLGRPGQHGPQLLDRPQRHDVGHHRRTGNQAFQLHGSLRGAGPAGCHGVGPFACGQKQNLHGRQLRRQAQAAGRQGMLVTGLYARSRICASGSARGGSPPNPPGKSCRYTTVEASSFQGCAGSGAGRDAQGHRIVTLQHVQVHRAQGRSEWERPDQA